MPNTMTPEPDTAQALEARLTQLQADRASATARLETLDAQVTTALADGENADDEMAEQATLERKRRALDAAIAKLETELPELRDAEGIAAASKRMTGIARAYGSLLAQREDDERRYAEAVAAVQEAAGRINRRFADLIQLRAEANALADRFEVPPPDLVGVTPPAMRELPAVTVRFVDSGFVQVETEQDAHKLRRRRTYREIRGTPGYEIIVQAGLRDFAPLNPTQERVVATRARQAEEDEQTVQRFAAEQPRALQRTRL